MLHNKYPGLPRWVPIITKNGLVSYGSRNPVTLTGLSISLQTPPQLVLHEGSPEGFSCKSP